MGGGGGGGSPEIQETPEQKELAEIGVERMKRYEDVIKPVEDAYIENASKIGEGEADLAAGMASADAAQQFAGVEERAESQQIGSGAAPGSGRFNEAVAGANDAEASGRALSEVGAREGSEDRRLSALQDVVNIGLGKAAEGQQGLSEVAGREAQENISETQTAFAEDMAEDQAVASTIGGAAGLGASYLEPSSPGTGGVAGNVPMRQSGGGLSSARRRGASPIGHNYGGL